MGIHGFWDLVEETKRNIHLSDLKGKTLAVDLSAWIVQFSQVNTEASFPKSYLCCRGIFFRTLKLLDNGITPVFVLDGPHPPKVKKKIKSRETFSKISKQYKELLEAMGLPVLESDGEAEKLCAYLNQRNLVDGCLTNDGDALVYGAKLVYKTNAKDKSNYTTFDEYDFQRIKDNLNLVQQDLVVFTTLSGGDLCDGVHGLGKAKISKLLKELKRNNFENTLARVQSWRDNPDLSLIEEDKQRMKTLKKGEHCSICLHTGNKRRHEKDGCPSCKMNSSCLDASGQSQISTVKPCSCLYHSTEEKWKPHEAELEIRKMALDTDPDFPDSEVIDEFLIHSQTLPEVLTLSVRIANYVKVEQILSKHKVTFSLNDKTGSTQYGALLSHFVPVKIKMVLFNMLPSVTLHPVRILKEVTKDYEKFYLVRWDKEDFEGYSGEDDTFYETKVPVELFSSNFPEMTQEFTALRSKAANPTGKEKQQDDPKQPKITSVFQVKKKAKGDPEPSTSKQLTE